MRDIQAYLVQYDFIDYKKKKKKDLFILYNPCTINNNNKKDTVESYGMYCKWGTK